MTGVLFAVPVISMRFCGLSTHRKLDLKAPLWCKLCKLFDTKYELKSMIPQEISESSVQLLTSNSTKLNSGEVNYSKMDGKCT